MDHPFLAERLLMQAAGKGCIGAPPVAAGPRSNEKGITVAMAGSEGLEPPTLRFEA